MNNLSWFLYIADVLPNLQTGAGILLIVAGLLGLPAMLFFALGHSDQPTVIPRPPYKAFTAVVLVAGLLAAFVPSKGTIYLIAGSEAGETVVTSKEGKEILSDIHQVIKHQLSELKGDTNE